MTTARYTADSITDDSLDELYENANRGWRRGDEWKERALKAEAAVKRAERLARRWAILRAHGGAAVELRATLAEPKENATP
ncbi:hypothetical protein [Streptomyces shenzhenensis]|uniref:Uncharacterized protein n=1 Tax=Streptomyces shenzhenensis TaxID=943815 RepID=A0A3M0I5B2_9ACTN|nr:hypothetical protein [Streptomyces shenzhenensis]RMB81299.1 hypothetical protein CTZ28_35455 [Streptomyces shenzhenensis]